MDKKQLLELSAVMNGLNVTMTKLVNCLTGESGRIADLRRQLKYIPVMKFPNHVQAVVLSANVAQDVEIPQGTKLIQFRGDGDYYVSLTGNASIPTTTDNTGRSSLYWPEDQFFYAEDIRSISLISAALTRKVTVHCYM